MSYQIDPRKPDWVSQLPPIHHDPDITWIDDNSDGSPAERRLQDRRSDDKPSNPKDRAATNRVPLDLVPDTLNLYAAMAFAEGDSKYIAHNYRVAGVRVSVYVGALRRHLMRYFNGEWADVKTGVPHLSSVAACTAILIDGHVMGNIVDDRPPAIDLNEEMSRAEEVIAHVYRMNADKRPVGVEYTALSSGILLPVATPQKKVGA